MAEVEYQRAPLGGSARFRVTDDRIEELDASGNAKRAVPFANLRHIRWQVTYAKRMMIRSLDLSGSSARMSLAQTASARAAPAGDVLGPYLDGVRAVLTRISETRPDLSVEQGAPAGLRWFYFVMVLAIGAVMLIPLSEVSNHRKAAELWWVSAVLVAGIALSLLFAWRVAPWRPGFRTSPRDLLVSLGG